MTQPQTEDLIDVTRSILRFTEEMLTLMRDSCAQAVAGSRVVTAADLERLVEQCDMAIVQTQTVRSRCNELLGGEQSPPSRVM